LASRISPFSLRVEITHRGQVVEAEIPGVRDGEFVLRGAQLLVLHLQLDLVYLKLVEQIQGFLKWDICAMVRRVAPVSGLLAPQHLRSPAQASRIILMLIVLPHRSPPGSLHRSQQTRIT